MARVEEDTPRATFSMRTWFGFKWAVDDLAHRRLNRRWHRRLAGWLCDRLDDELQSNRG